MEIKTIAPILVLSTQVETTLAGMNEAIGDLPQRMAEIIGNAGRQIIGPQIWIYHSADGTPHLPITIQVTFPIDQSFDCPPPFECTDLPPFRCLTGVNRGAWAEVGKVYEELMQEAKMLNQTPNFTSREIYVVCDFDNQANCITEVQLGVV